MTAKNQRSQVERATPADRMLRVLPALTENQLRCLRWILDYFNKNRHYPTQREIADEMKIKSPTAEMYVGPLVEKGYLTRVPGRHRNIRLTGDALEKLEILGMSVEGNS